MRNEIKKSHGVRGIEKSTAYSLIVKSLNSFAKIQIYSEQTKKNHMAGKTLGIDLGTNSLGIALRDPDKGINLIDQIEYYNSIIFSSGVGNSKSGEYSYASERTKHRSKRRLYQARKYRIWATLKVLIEHSCCPLSAQDLEKWSKYDKEKGFKREYPINATEFEQWVRLDFDNDGIADYTSPYQLRDVLMHKTIDWNNTTDRYKFGRAMYHIAQRRGFKSSKGETLKEMTEKQMSEEFDISASLKKSEEKKSGKLEKYKTERNLPTAGCAFAQLEREGVRVRGSEYQAVRSQLHEEVDAICKYQGIDQICPPLYRSLISTKRNEGTIFYRRPLRSQKGNIGKCTLEPKQRRCHLSHPDSEEANALEIINSIRFTIDNETRALNEDERATIFENVFTQARKTFKFADIRIAIEKIHDIKLDYQNKTINYADDTTVAGCPTINRLKKILGSDWRSQTITTYRERTNYKTGEVHTISYNYEDIWHICFNSDDAEDIIDFADKAGCFTDKQKDEMVRLWNTIRDGYASLSLKAIRNILPMLRMGLIYSDAVAFAKIPHIIGQERWNKESGEIIKLLNEGLAQHRKEVNAIKIANTLISAYKSQDFEHQQAYKNTDYQLDEQDHADIQRSITETLTPKTWNQLSGEEQKELTENVTKLYQEYFHSSKRSYYTSPRQTDKIMEILKSRYELSDQPEATTLYHHSHESPFPKNKPTTIEVDNKVISTPLLPTPNIGAIKNPVALRALHILKKTLNHMLEKGMIDQYTRIVVETARDMNDANWRKAIEQYQKENQKENDAIAEIIKEFRPNYSDDDIARGKFLFEQAEEGINIPQNQRSKALNFKRDLEKYKAYRDQKFICLYTGKHISLADLFNDNTYDIEHTIPRSISFDDSMANKTICDTHYNRTKKQNKLPSELSNYDEILQRIKPWTEKVKHIKQQITFWAGESKKASTIERKNECIQQRHLWQLELEYWEAKVKTFTIKKEEIGTGFRNRQLNDTRIITKYAFHYLKSVFEKVDVQKGTATSIFRKILEIQSLDEKKNRNLHSHHAIDAIVLTTIPQAVIRDKMADSFYNLQELKKALENPNTPIQEKENITSKIKHIETEIVRHKQQCRIGSVNRLVDFVENNILIHHIVKDQTLTPSRRRRRSGGKVIKGQWVQGDSIRASLHQDSYYGAIRKPDNSYGMVIRKLITLLNEKDLESIVDPVIRKTIAEHCQEQKKAGNSFTKAIEMDIYMKDSNGKPITHDRNGHIISPIRHVRCFAKAGRGYLSRNTALKIKKQTYPSKHDHKNTYYVQNDSNYLCLLYEGTIKGKTKREMRLINYFEIAQLKSHNLSNLLSEPEFNAIPTTNGEQLTLRAVIKSGTRLLFYEKHQEEIDFNNKTELNKRLYIVNKFNINNTTTLYLSRHIEARKESDIPKEEQNTAYSFSEAPAYLTLKADKIQALVEGVDFEISPIGTILLKQ